MTQKELDRIIHHLILNGSTTQNLGLLDGKMGICIFFYLYSRKNKNKLYEELAGYFLDEIYEKINNSTTIGFAGGLCGIAWGIEYLIQKKIVKADRDEVLEEIDWKILQININYIKDYSLEYGLKGIAYYVINRYYNRQEPYKLINEEYLNNLIRILKKQGKDSECDFLIIELSNILKGDTINHNKDSILEKIINEISYNPKDLFKASRNIGIRNNGYTGIALKLIFRNHEK